MAVYEDLLLLSLGKYGSVRYNIDGGGGGVVDAALRRELGTDFAFR